MERLRGLRLNRTGLIAALTLLPLTPLVAALVYRVAIGSGLSVFSPPAGFDTYINLRTLIWSVLVVATAAALLPAGLVLMRRPNASGAWSLGLITIALGVIGTAYAVARLVWDFPTISVFAVLWFASLSIVPAVLGIRLMRRKGFTSQRALALVAMTPGIVGLVSSAGWIHWLVNSQAGPSGLIAAHTAGVVALAVIPLAVGVHLWRSKRASPVRTLGIVVIMLAVSGAFYRLTDLTSYFAAFEGWRASTIVDVATVLVLLLASTSVGIVFIRKKTIPNVQALALASIAMGVVGFTYCISVFLTTLFSVPWTLYLPSIGVTILLLLPLVGALGVVPASAGVLLMRRTHASGPWALGLVALVLGVIGTTFSAVQLLAASAAPTSLLPIIELTLLNTAWLP